MAWEWVGTASVGLAGIAATYWTGQRGREHAKDLADLKNNHDLALAREQRQQQRQAEAYIELLTSVQDFTQHLRLADRTTGQYPEGSNVPSLDSFSKIKALLTAYGSTATTKLYDEWLSSLWSANDTRARLRKAHTADQAKEVLDARRVFADQIKLLNGAIERLGEQIANELNSYGRPLG